MFGNAHVDEFSWRDSEHNVARAATAYYRDHEAFAERGALIRTGGRFPSIDDLLVGQPPLRDSLTDDIEIFVARARQIASATDGLRAVLADFGLYPCSEGAVRVFDMVSGMGANPFEEHRLEEIRLRAAWYAAFFGVSNLKRELISTPRSFDIRRISYLTGLMFRTGAFYEASDWKPGTQEETYLDGHLILRRLGAGVEAIDWFQDHHNDAADFVAERITREHLFHLANPPDADADDPVSLDQRVLENDHQARRAVEAKTVSALQTPTIDCDDPVIAAEAAQTISDLLGTPRLTVVPRIDVVGTSDQKSFLTQFVKLSTVGLPMTVASDIDAIRRGLCAGWPHAADVVAQILSGVRDCEPVRIRPTLLVGSPGSGKTRLLGEIVSRLGLAHAIYPCASVADGSFGGTPAQWSSRRASVPLELIRSSMKANPAIVLDELEKTGRSSQNGSLVNAVLPMLERHSASAYFETAIEASVDLSMVSFLATANDASSIPDPLRDRFRIIMMPDPDVEHLDVLLDGVLVELAEDRGVPIGAVADLEQDEVNVIRKAWGGGSIRRLKAAVSAALDYRERARTLQ